MGISAFIDMAELQKAQDSKGNFNHFAGGYTGLVQLTDCKFDREKSTPGVQGAPYFAANFKIITSNLVAPTVINTPEDREAATDAGRMSPGSSADYFSNGKVMLANVQSMVMALLGVTDVRLVQPKMPQNPDGMDPVDYQQTVQLLLEGPLNAAGQPAGTPGAIGKFLHCVCLRGVTKTGPRAGQPNSVAHFTPASKEELAAAGIAVE